MAKKSVAKINPKEQYTQIFLESAGWNADEESVKKYKPVFWYSYRDKDSGGLRLTDKGLEFVVEQADLKTYRVEFPSGFSFTPQTMIWLDQYLNTPFFVDKKSITVISEKAAFELYLFSGDVRKFGLAKSLSKRLNQD
jgi:hypothetical protein